MRQAIAEGIDLAEQLAALPFKAARVALKETGLGKRPIGDLVQESLQLSEGLARIPFKALSVLMAADCGKNQKMEARLSALELQVQQMADQR